MEDIEKDELEEIEMPKWYLQLRKAAGQMFAGCCSAEALILVAIRHVLPQNVINIMHMIIIPFGVLCAIMGGVRALETLYKYLEVYKKLK